MNEKWIRALIKPVSVTAILFLILIFKKWSETNNYQNIIIMNKFTPLRNYIFDRLYHPTHGYFCKPSKQHLI